MDMDDQVVFYKSAFRHGISREYALCAYANYLSELLLWDEPQKVMYFGFDTKGRALEVGAVIELDGRVAVIHAMKLRKQYERYLHQ